MSRRLSIMAVLISLLTAPAMAGEAAHAGEVKTASFTPREMAHCMMRRLRAHNSESYRDAYKTCKQQFDSAQAERATETANLDSTPAQPAKP